MTGQTQAALVSALVLLPAAAGLLVLAGPALVRRAAASLTVAASLGSVGLVVLLAATGSQGVTLPIGWAAPLAVQVAWRLDGATLALAGLVAGIGVLVLQYSGTYLHGEPKTSRTIAALALFESAMLGLVLADNLFVLFVFWELTSLASFFLIATDADEREDAFPAAQQALLVTAGGGLPMLVGFLYLALETGTASLALLRQSGVDPHVATVALALILPGALTKSAQVPFHFWLPGAMAAPTPISAYLHSATMVKAGVILLLFLAPVLGESWLWGAALVPLGAATCIWGSWRALGQDDVKLLMAWSTVAQLGLLVLVIGLGTDLALRAALLHLFAHAFFKAALFLAVGGVDHAAHTRRLSELGGLARHAPLLATISVVCAASMAGVIPTAGFLSKELMLEEGLHAQGWLRVVALAGIIVGSIGTVWYTARFTLATFFGTPRSEGARDAHAPETGLVAGPALLAALTLAAGLAAGAAGRVFLDPVARALTGRPFEAVPLALWHGITAPFLVSAGILAAGLAAHAATGLRRYGPAGLAPSGPDLFEAFLARSQAAGTALNGWLAAAPPTAYIAVVLVAGFAGTLPVAFSGAFGGLTAPDGAGLLLAGIIAVATAALLVGPGRLAQVLLLSVVGFAVALLYRFMRAPDLMLTQVLVEVISTVFLALAVRLLPAWEPVTPRGVLRTGGRLLVALGAGAGAAAVAATLFVLPADTRLKTFFFEAGPAISKGTNLVNVILVDFRGLDTLVETAVILLAAVGVGGLLRRREVGPRGGQP